MPVARTKTDLIIEIWEGLDCESVGAREIELIEIEIRQEYGDAAVDTPMRMARLLADEGAELRHSEIMALHLKRVRKSPYAAAVDNTVRLDDLRSASASIRRLESLRRKYAEAGDRDGLRLVREQAIGGKQAVEMKAEKTSGSRRDTFKEIAEWLRIWLQTPDMFDGWFKLRCQSTEFRTKFGPLDKA